MLLLLKLIWAAGIDADHPMAEGWLSKPNSLEKRDMG